MAKEAKKASASYSPKPMTAAAKEKTKSAAATKQYKKYGASSVKVGEFYDWKLNVGKKKPKSLASKVGSAAGKVAGVAKRAKTTAREARDVVTAVGTSARSRLNTRSYRSATGGLKSTPTSKANIAAADKNLKKQLKETVKAATTGKKGTTSAQTGGKPSKKR